MKDSEIELCVLTMNYDSGEGNVWMHGDFYAKDPVTRITIIQDWLAALMRIEELLLNQKPTTKKESKND